MKDDHSVVGVFNFLTLGVWMGAAWKVRDNLKTTLGSAAGQLAASTGYTRVFRKENEVPYCDTSVPFLIDNSQPEISGLSATAENGGLRLRFTGSDSATKSLGHPSGGKCLARLN